MHRLALVIFSFAATPALAGGEARCWDYGMEAGLFGWQQAPSTACREGRTVEGTPVTPAEPDMQLLPETAKAGSPSGETETTFTFSGKAYLGLAALF